MFEVIFVSFAFSFGMAVRYLGLPPLVGFLASGFAINYFGNSLGVPAGTSDVLQHLAHLGVLMLLFSVGLKLKLNQMLKPEVLGGSFLHFILSVVFVAPLVAAFSDYSWRVSIFIAISLAFSSTVLAAKLLETKREISVFHGRTSVGVLVVQDIISLVLLAVFSEKVPSPWALLIFTLPFFRPALHKLVDITGHGELMVLMGMLFSLVLGGSGFAVLGLSPEIGAICMGAILSNHPRARELSDSIWSLKEIFLVCFFLQIGMAGLPTLDALKFALLASLILPFKLLLFYFVFVCFKLRARTALLSAITLTSFSEFGLIIAASVYPDLLVPLALSMSFSFIILAPVNRYSHQIFERMEKVLSRFQRQAVHPDEQPKDLGDAQVLIFGMGRTGLAAYKLLDSKGMRVIGLDADSYKAQAHVAEGRNAFFADAEDSSFWSGVDLSKIETAILAMDDILAKLIAARMLRRYGFSGPIISHALHEDHQERILEAGATHTYLTMSQAGIGLAESALEALEQDSEKVSVIPIDKLVNS